MAGVNCEGSILVNLGRSELSRRGLAADDAVSASTVDMVRAVVEEQEEVMVLALRSVADVDEMVAAWAEKARME